VKDRDARDVLEATRDQVKVAPHATDARIGVEAGEDGIAEASRGRHDAGTIAQLAFARINPRPTR
jgi:hypothetical protein